VGSKSSVSTQLPFGEHHSPLVQARGPLSLQLTQRPFSQTRPSQSPAPTQVESTTRTH
jgi:hypothetical protein